MSEEKKDKKVAEAKASAAKDNKEVEKEKTEEKNSEEWLEEELEDVNLEKDSSDSDNDESDADSLMKKAAAKIEELQADLRESNNKYMRLHAEWDTYRRRIKEQRVQDKLTATEGLVTDVLPVLDDFERSINYAKENSENGLLEGVEAVYSKLISCLEKSNVEVLNPEQGETFDALKHQAVATVENSDFYDESVYAVLQKGYKMGKKVIRPAMISVTTGGDKRPDPEEEKAETENKEE